MAQSKKKYYFIIVNRVKRGLGGQNVTASIYTVKRGDIVYVGQAKWNTAYGKNEKSEVYDVLHNKKLVTAKEYKDNHGMYHERTSKVIIKSL